MRAPVYLLLALAANAAIAQYPEKPNGTCDVDNQCGYSCTDEGCIWVACNGLDCVEESGQKFKWTQAKKDEHYKEGLCQPDPDTDETIPSVCFRQCKSTPDCLTDEYCNPSKSRCDKKLEPGGVCKQDTDCDTMSCVEGKCGSNIGKLCKEDGDCPAENGERFTRLCSKKGTCLKASVLHGETCLEDAQCVTGCCNSDGKCNYCKKCSSDRECFHPNTPDNLYCYKSYNSDKDNICKPTKGEQGQRCSKHDDCGSGLHCFKSNNNPIKICQVANGREGSPCHGSRKDECARYRLRCFRGQCSREKCGTAGDGCVFSSCCDAFTCRKHGVLNNSCV